MDPARIKTSVACGWLGLLALMLGSFLISQSATAGQDSGFGLASLPRTPRQSVVPSSLHPTETLRARVPRSRPEALTLLQRVEARLSASSEAPSDPSMLLAELDAATRFARSLDRKGIGEESFQWHRAGSAELFSGSNRLVIRPLTGIRFVSAIALDISGGEVAIDRVRVYSAAGLVFEFGSGRAPTSVRDAAELLLLERELELTAVEVFYRKPAESSEIRIEVSGGISVEPRYAAECAYRLQVARQSLARHQPAAAAERVRESIALLKTIH